MTRKGYNTNQKYLIQSVKNTRKYVTHGRNPAVLIAVNKAGLHIFGSTEMEKVVRDHIDQFIAASKKDKKGLNDEDTEVVRQNLPPSPAQSGGDIVSALYSNSDTPRLPYRLDAMSEEDVKDYLLPIIRKELAIHKGIQISRIRWSDPAHMPPCWPNNMAPWEMVGNPAHSQKQQLGHQMVDIMKAAIYNHLTMKGIDPSTYIDPHCDQKKLKNKLRARGNKFTSQVPSQNVLTSLSNSSEQAPSVLPEPLATSEPAPSLSPNVPVSPLIDSVAPCPRISVPITDVMSPVSEMLTDSPQRNQETPHITLNEAPEFDVYTDSEIFDTSVQNDSFGRRILPRRSSTPEDPLQQQPEQQPEQQQTPPQQQSSPEVLRPSTSRQLFPSECGRGRGKGGRHMVVQRDQLVAASNTSEAIKKKWNDWKLSYEAELKKEIGKKRGVDPMVCKRCGKPYDKSKYLNHNLKSCPDKHPYMMWYKFKEASNK